MRKIMRGGNVKTNQKQLRVRYFAKKAQKMPKKLKILPKPNFPNLPELHNLSNFTPYKLGYYHGFCYILSFLR